MNKEGPTTKYHQPHNLELKMYEWLDTDNQIYVLSQGKTQHKIQIYTFLVFIYVEIQKCCFETLLSSLTSQNVNKIFTMTNCLFLSIIEA